MNYLQLCELLHFMLQHFPAGIREDFVLIENNSHASLVSVSFKWSWLNRNWAIYG